MGRYFGENVFGESSMFLRSVLSFVSLSFLVGLMFLNAGCSAIEYYDFEPENPYQKLPKSSIPDVMGASSLFSGHS